MDLNEKERGGAAERRLTVEPPPFSGPGVKQTEHRLPDHC